MGRRVADHIWSLEGIAALLDQSPSMIQTKGVQRASGTPPVGSESLNLDQTGLRAQVVVGQAETLWRVDSS